MTQIKLAGENISYATFKNSVCRSTKRLKEFLNFYCGIVSLVLILFLLSCAHQQEEVIVGAWEGVDEDGYYFEWRISECRSSILIDESSYSAFYFSNQWKSDTLLFIDANDEFKFQWVVNELENKTIKISEYSKEYTLKKVMSKVECPKYDEMESTEFVEHILARKPDSLD
ncbi:hypothetical protein GYB22_00995 [bacterium]|nr:hypothetical protein [bacterium]